MTIPTAPDRPVPDTRLPVRIAHFIGGSHVEADSGQTFETNDPHDLTLLGVVARGSADVGERAIAAARSAFDDGPWRRMSVEDRAGLLCALANAVDAHVDELALLETRDSGKLLRLTRHIDMPRVAHNLRFFADYAKMAGNEAYDTADGLAYTLYPPAGVVAAIAPWNAPLMLATWKVAPALAFGNTVVLKPSPRAPLTAARFGELAAEVGIPDGVINVVHGFGEDEVAGPLIRDPRVDRITFTGSTATGVRVLRAAAENLTPVSAELGGKSANIVFADADLDLAVAESVKAIFGGSGQVCYAGSRLLVQREILPEFRERFIAAASALIVGDPKSADAQIGPLIDRAHLDNVDAYVHLARQEGAEVLLGGGRADGEGISQGCYYAPTILAGLPNNSRVAQDEIFGPVELLLPFDDEREAIRLANASRFGLAGMLFTSDLNRAHRLAAQWRAGTVWVNCYAVRDLRLPFGGEGRSGLGREGGRYSRDFLTEPRAVSLGRSRDVGGD